jgi:hypothetical protein
MTFSLKLLVWSKTLSQEYFRRSKTLSQLMVEEVKTLTLDIYPAILNIGSLGGERVSF